MSSGLRGGIEAGRLRRLASHYLAYGVRRERSTWEALSFGAHQARGRLKIVVPDSAMGSAFHLSYCVALERLCDLLELWLDDQLGPQAMSLQLRPRSVSLRCRRTIVAPSVQFSLSVEQIRLDGGGVQWAARFAIDGDAFGGRIEGFSTQRDKRMTRAQIPAVRISRLGFQESRLRGWGATSPGSPQTEPVDLRALSDRLGQLAVLQCGLVTGCDVKREEYLLRRLSLEERGRLDARGFPIEVWCERQGRARSYDYLQLRMRLGADDVVVRIDIVVPRLSSVSPH